MKRLLIVEDEKIIRQGLRVMVQRAPVEVEEVLECANGEEALKLLRQTQIDVLLTDVRMPHMDGISLIQRLRELPFPPLPVIISGYDDFSYAVEALRCGAKEYLLKPVSREDIAKVLNSLESILKERSFRERQKQQILKYVTLDPDALPQDQEDAQKQFDSLIGEASFFVVASGSPIESGCSAICLEAAKPPKFLYLFQETGEKRQEPLAAPGYSGKSLIHTGFGEFAQACEEAKEAYFSAFLLGKSMVRYEPSSLTPAFPKEEIDRLVLLLGTEKITQAKKIYERLFAEGACGNLSGPGFRETLGSLLHGVENLYLSLLSDGAARLSLLWDPCLFENFSAYREALWRFLSESNQEILSRRSLSKRQEKMEEAIAYVRENYRKDLNMAMVSNHISISYSFFSQAFKEYTGKNFSDYLKEFRIQKAKELLSGTGLHISEIGRQVGFKNEKHFMKVFRNLVGVSPTEYRQNAGRSQ